MCDLMRIKKIKEDNNMQVLYMAPKFNLYAHTSITLIRLY